MSMYDMKIAWITLYLLLKQNLTHWEIFAKKGPSGGCDFYWAMF